MPSFTNLLATATASFGSHRSSPTDSTSCWPSTPPAALMSRTAAWAPFCICSPNDAYWPVIGPAVAILISAWALAAVRPSSAAAAAVTMYLFICEVSSIARLLFYSSASVEVLPEGKRRNPVSVCRTTRRR